MLNYDKRFSEETEQSFNLSNIETETKIKLIGIGGGGCNAINRMIESGVSNIEFIAVNTDVQILKKSNAKRILQIGKHATKGLGAGARPEIGEKAAQEDIEEIKKIVANTDMIFITAGMGGGTGTGASPVFAKAAKEAGALTVAVVTLPFEFEGKKRMEVARQGIEKLKEYVDTIIVISNSRIFNVIERKASITQAFSKIDEVLMNAVKGISSIIVDTGIINVDFADVRTVLSNKGEAIMGIGIGQGESRAVEAARMAFENPLIENTSLKNAGAVVVNVIGGPDFSINEFNEASSTISEYCREDAEKIIGVTTDDSLKDKVKIIIIATDFDKNAENKIINEQKINNEELIVKESNVKFINIQDVTKNNGKFRTFLDNEERLRRIRSLREIRSMEENEELDIPTFYRKQQKMN